METETSRKANGRGPKLKKGAFQEAITESAKVDQQATVDALEANTFPLDLPVKLTDEERVAAGVANAVRRRELDARKEACKEVATAIRDDEKNLHADILLQEKGEALRSVKCVERIVFEQNQAHTIRLDTSEIVPSKTRALNFDERQVSLDIGEPSGDDNADLFGDEP